MLSDSDFLRYQRQICLDEIGELGQQRLLQSSVLIIGCGGLGNAAALYLMAAGIGRLIIADDDIVEVSNLSRQIAYRDHHVGMTKVRALSESLRQLNPGSQVRTIERRMDKTLLELEVAMVDLVLDCSDNLETRHAVNQACFDTNVPLVSGAAIGWEGQLIALDFNRQTSGCYSCAVPFSHIPTLNKCSELGVVGPIVGTIGNLQALMALQMLLGMPEVQTQKLIRFDGKTMQWKSWALISDPECSVCSNDPTANERAREEQ